MTARPTVGVFAPIHRLLSHQVEWATAFCDGLRRHGFVVDIVPGPDYRPVDLAVFWGFRATHIMDGQRESGGRFIVMERGFVDRMEYTSLGFDGLNGRAQFPAPPPGSDRFARLFPGALKTRPWSAPASDAYVLVMGQVHGDASIKHIDIDGWYQATVDVLQAHFDRPVRFRMHPGHRGSGWTPRGAEVDSQSLEEALAGAAWVVTFNSNSGVDAALAGVPVVTVDRGAMAWRVAGHEISSEPPLPAAGLRAAWAEQLAWCQWSKAEIAAGTAWEALTSCF